MTKTVTRFVLTYVNKHGERTLMQPAQGRFTFATPEEAQAHLDAIMTNNSAKTIAQAWGEHDLKVKITPCECWAGHFDPVRVIFDEDAS